MRIELRMVQSAHGKEVPDAVEVAQGRLHFVAVRAVDNMSTLLGSLTAPWDCAKDQPHTTRRVLVPESGNAGTRRRVRGGCQAGQTGGVTRHVTRLEPLVNHQPWMHRRLVQFRLAQFQ